MQCVCEWFFFPLRQWKIICKIIILAHQQRDQNKLQAADIKRISCAICNINVRNLIFSAACNLINIPPKT